MSIISKISDTYEKEGLSGIYNKILIRMKIREQKFNLAEHFSFIEQKPKCVGDIKDIKNNGKLLINWIIPEMGKCSGGHLNIFRFASMLENDGFHCRIYTMTNSAYPDNESLMSFTYENYPIIDKTIELIAGCNSVEPSDITIATGASSAYVVNLVSNTRAKAYFVQDFEPYFYSVGTEYAIAEETYNMGLYGITAGKWLCKKLADEYGMWTRAFDFSYDKDLYKVHPYNGVNNRIFFYARPCTPRRFFEIGFLALIKICKANPDIEVVFAGENLEGIEIPFKHQNLGVCDTEKLSDIYASCDLCIALSGTNLSLLPLEIMASGSIVVSNDGDNNWLLNEDNAMIVSLTPNSIAENVLDFYDNPKKYDKVRQAGIQLAQSSSWEKEGKKVKQYLLEILDIEKEK